VNMNVGPIGRNGALGFDKRVYSKLLFSMRRSGEIFHLQSALLIHLSIVEFQSV